MKLITIACFLSSLALHNAQAQPFPAKPITMVVPYPAGGANDMLGRLLGQKMGENLNQAVVVENKAGAGAMIGANYVAKSAPDGYTLLVGGLATHAASPNLSKAEYNPLSDFESVGLIGSAPIILITYNDSPYKTLADVVADAKKKAGNVMYASSGNGSPLHLAGQLFASTYNIDLTHVPYKGGTAHMLDLMGGRVGVVFDTATNAMSYLKGGKVRALAVSTPKRLSDLPNVPTFAESGYEKFDFTAWYGLFAAGKTPKEVVAKLSASLATALKNPEVIEKLKGVGVSTASGDSAELAKLVPTEYERIGKLIKAANIKAD
ncbi:MAG: hypothetical protein RLZZ502_1764 [Pseudomonadota bacterium]|jgi:tripartite-type tricarboxylate transporter receptor subunit TctC